MAKGRKKRQWPKKAVAGVKQRRKPKFTLTVEQVFQKCKEQGHRLICAGIVLAMRSLMEKFGWTEEELAEHSHVSRQMISAMLNVQRVGTPDILDKLACTFGLDYAGLAVLAGLEARAEVPLWWHGA